MASRKGSTGLEWLLREADAPPPESAGSTESALESLGNSEAKPGDAEKPTNSEPPRPALAPVPAVPEPWMVKPAGDAVPVAARALDALFAEPTLSPPPVVPLAPSSVSSHATTRTGSRGNRRIHPRVLVPFDVRYKKGSEQIAGRGVNLSVGGMFFATTRHLPEGEVFQAQVTFPSREGRRIAVIVEVIWATAGDPDDAEKSPAGMGVKFLDVDDKDLPFLSEVVESSPRAPLEKPG